MAASDSTYRDTKALHVVFAVSSIAMLATVIWMFADDYYRDWKVEQRVFRDVEEEMTKRQVLAAAPTDVDVEKITELDKQVKAKKAELTAARDAMEKGLGDLPSRKLKKENEFQNVKADYDSVMTFYNRAVEVHEEGTQSKEALKHRAHLDKIYTKMQGLKDEVEKNKAAYDAAAQSAGLPKLEAELAAAEKAHKEMLADFDRFIKLASQKRWKFSDTFRQLPIVDGFSSPTKIQQYTLNDLPIDYSFKYVTRYDRCTTCHLGMEKGAFDKATLAGLTDDPNSDSELAGRYAGAKMILEKRRAEGAKDLPRPDAIRPRQLDKSRLTSSRVEQYCGHSRLDLFVDATSPHPAEKFGCTICHSGQGSGTAFNDASHFPNDASAKEQWKKDFGWKSNHYWDYPMLASRFVESSCLKCHHEVTDLIREGNKVEAPKLVKGYNLVRELGCFGCHEIAGTKGGRKVGPDMRLEPEPPVDSLSPAERVAAMRDPLNAPGSLRKVGPSLNRLAEKTGEDWLKAWLKAPRGFRPDTKMPHFYGQANNDEEALKGTGQEKFPDTEVNAVAYYLVQKSKQQIDDLKRAHTEPPAQKQADLAQSETLKARIAAAEKRLADPKLKADDKPALQADLASSQKALAALTAKMKTRDDLLALPAPVSLLDLSKVGAGDAVRGRMHFQEKGCMACHSHRGTEQGAGDAVDGKKIPTMLGDSSFGPDLSRVALKLNPAGTPEDARKWLVSWLLNPSAHSPRTLMPNVQISIEDANDIAVWLLGQKPAWEDKPAVAAAEVETLKSMARVYLEKVLPRSEVNAGLENGFKVSRLKQFAADADERELGGSLDGKKDEDLVPADEAKLKMYVGKKAVGNMGCYACHTIPGFQSAKPIGAALNEWGKKDVERLAYEDAEKFVEKHFRIVASRTDPKDPSKPSADWHADSTGKKPYEKYFADMLDHHGRTREGFLHLKLAEPRSYDYGRIKPWEDRLRMPQFKFARPKKQAGESDEAFAARSLKEEAEGREAVMTFILGLLAEPIPPQFVNKPAGDRLAEVKGRQVLDKYNCGGCHIIRPGSIEFKPLDMKKFDALPSVRMEETAYTGDDYVYPEHIAWVGREPGLAERLKVHGVTPPIEVKFGGDDDEGSKEIQVRLMQALRYRQGNTKSGKARDIPAGSDVFIPPDWITSNTPQYGGAFTSQLAQYLQRKDRENFGGQAKLSNAYAAAPPLLVGEGEKVQPDWLFKFLLNPGRIRPLAVLRMPKFNMSPEEAQALVNYFAAVDKVQNPGIGLSYPYVPVPQREEAYIRARTAEYVARLRAENKYDARKAEFQTFWEQQLAAEKVEADRKLKEAQDRLAMAAAAVKEDAQKQVDEAKKAADALAERVSKKDVSLFVKDWEERQAYLADAGRTVAHMNLCLTCHRAGGYPGKEDKGPPLDNVAERLRPDWTQRWITKPDRFLHYVSVMPVNFKAVGPRENQDAFLGSSEDQIRATRDYLMLYPQIRDWPILRARPMLGLTPAPMAAPPPK